MANNTIISAPSFWYDESSECYRFRPNLSREEWYEMTHLIRRFKLDTLFKTDNTIWPRSFCVSYCPIASAFALTTFQSFTPKFHGENFISACRSLYKIAKAEGNLEKAKYEYEDAKKWYLENKMERGN